MPQHTTLWKKIGVALSALNAVASVPADRLGNVRESCVYVHFGAGTTAGTFVVEACHDESFTGTWANVGTIAWSAASKVEKAAITGIHRALRVRCSVVVANGTADVYIIGN